MRLIAARELVLAMALVAAGIGCRTEAVVAAETCGADPCCGGQPAAVDCAENRELSCVVPGDACAGGGAPYGCVDGSFFEQAPPACPSPSDGDAETNAEGGDNLIVNVVDAGPDEAGDGP